MSFLMSLVIVLSAVVTYKIPKAEIKPQRIYFGDAESFSNPGEIDYQQVIRATPEYQEIIRKKIERGTGKYWILLSKASDRITHAIPALAKDKKMDMITAAGYLQSLEKSIPVKDITIALIEKVKEKKR